MTQSFAIYINSTRKALNSKHQRLNLIKNFMLINNVIEIVSEWNTRHLFPQTNNSMSCLLFGNDHCRFHKSIFKRNSFTLGISNFRNSSSNRFIFTGILVKEKQMFIQTEFRHTTHTSITNVKQHQLMLMLSKQV